MTRVQYPENNGNRPGSNFEHRKWNDVRFFPRGMEFEQDFVTFYRRNQGEDFRKGAFDCYQGQGSTNLQVRGPIGPIGSKIFKILLVQSDVLDRPILVRGSLIKD